MDHNEDKEKGVDEKGCEGGGWREVDGGNDGDGGDDDEDNGKGGVGISNIGFITLLDWLIEEEVNVGNEEG